MRHIFACITVIGLVLAASPMRHAVAQDHGEPESEGQHSDQVEAEGHDMGGGHTAGDDVAAERAHEIAVHEPPAWYSWVVGGAAVLFVLAATLGSLAIVARGPEPPDPAEVHHAHGKGH